MKSKEIITQALSKKVGTIIFLIFSIIIVVLLQIFAILVIRNLVDNVFSVPNHPNLPFWVSLFVISLVLCFMMEIVSTNQTISLGTYVTTSLSKEVHSSGIRAEISEINKLDNDVIVQRITKDCRKIGNDYIGGEWVDFIKCIIVLVAIFVSMMVINPALGLITYVALPLFFMLIRSVDKHINKLENKTKIAMDIREQGINEDFEKIRSIKLKNGIIQEEEKFQKYINYYTSTQKQIVGLKEMNNRKIYDLFVGLIFALILGIGGYFSTRNLPIPGTIIAFILLTPYVYKAFKKIMNVSISTSNIEEEINAINFILSLKSEIKSEPINSLDDVHSLKFQDVTYFVNKNKIDIDSISFEVKRGEKLGIVAYDGDSNLTIFELLTKLIKPKEGMIMINNCDINRVNTFYLRDIVTAIPQERCLFNDTIANNITYPLPFDEYKYNDALNKSDLKEILATYEDKDQTIISENNPLPEDMMQRITLANAFYKDSKIFVLNEATSCLDVQSEEAIMKEIYKLKNKIVIIMSNKTYNVIQCDKVLIVDKDQVLEYGRVADLLQDRNSVLTKLIKKVKLTKNSKVS